MTDAYFISPAGTIISVEQTHLLKVLENPSNFDLTHEDIARVFTANKEPLGLDGKARSEILSGLLRKGWIRLRYDPRYDTLTIQVNEMSNVKWKYIRSFAQNILQNKKFSIYTEVKIIDLIPKSLEAMTLGTLSEIPLGEE